MAPAIAENPPASLPEGIRTRQTLVASRFPGHGTATHEQILRPPHAPLPRAPGSAGGPGGSDTVQFHRDHPSPARQPASLERSQVAARERTSIGTRCVPTQQVCIQVRVVTQTRSGSERKKPEICMLLLWNAIWTFIRSVLWSCTFRSRPRLHCTLLTCSAIQRNRWLLQTLPATHGEKRHTSVWKVCNQTIQEALLLESPDLAAQALTFLSSLWPDTCSLLPAPVHDGTPEETRESAQHGVLAKAPTIPWWCVVGRSLPGLSPHQFLGNVLAAFPICFVMTS
jgi:hypothetical protein